MRVQLVVCDMAGTTVHDGDAVGSSFRATLAAAGLKAAPEAISAVMGLHKPEALRRLVGPELPQARVDAMHEDFVARMMRYYETDPAVREVDGASALFATLHASGVKVALNTGFSRPIVNVLLARLGWHDGTTVDATVTSDEVAHGRPHPDMIRQLMRKLGVEDARSVAKVGDTLADLQEGSAMGCGWVVGITSGTHPREKLAPVPHTHLIDSLAELPGILGLATPSPR
jgi:phosphonatase-like hydrolase